MSVLDGGPGSDYVFASGPAADTINGGDGDDIVGFVPYDTRTHGADVVNGGPGLDEGRVELRLNAPAFTGPVDVALSLDGVANDGIAGQGANFVDVEDATALSLFVAVPTRTYGRATLTGNAAPNLIEGDNGNDVIDGGAGNDVLDGDDGDDTINARDGFVDRVVCDAGNDLAIVDPLDQVGQDCETVQVADAVVPEPDRTPPPPVVVPAPSPAAPAPPPPRPRHPHPRRAPVGVVAHQGSQGLRNGLPPGGREQGAGLPRDRQADDQGGQPDDRGPHRQALPLLHVLRTAAEVAPRAEGQGRVRRQRRAQRTLVTDQTRLAPSADGKRGGMYAELRMNALDAASLGSSAPPPEHPTVIGAVVDVRRAAVSSPSWPSQTAR